MATSQASDILRQIRATVLARDGVELTDGQLLESYVNRRDEAPLAVLVQRHGPLVWGVCCRVLRSHHDAEDAFQAAFLVLVRKAASIASHKLLANWLYGVAHQTSLNARAIAARRTARKRQVSQMPEPAVTESDRWHDLQPVLDQELSRLAGQVPGGHRPVRSGEQDPQGSRFATGCARRDDCGPAGQGPGTMLAKRLARRGVVLSGVCWRRRWRGVRRQRMCRPRWSLPRSRPQLCLRPDLRRPG